MKNRDVLEINEKYRSWLTQMGLMSFEQLMFSHIGCVVKQNVRRIKGCGKVVYLKQHFATPILKSIEKYLQGQYPHAAPFDEYIHICSLQQAQLPVMIPIAAGERRILGFPVCGFILVDEVKGVRLNELLSQVGTENEKTALLRAFGRLLARLHQHGFYTPLRFKDIIVTDENETSLVMIDRESRNSYPRHRSKAKAKRSLNTSFRRIKRDFPELNEHQISTVIEAYLCY